MTDITKEIHELNSLTSRKTSTTKNINHLQDEKKMICEAQTHIKELETWNIEAEEALLTTLEEQRKLQEK